MTISRTKAMAAAGGLGVGGLGALRLAGVELPGRSEPVPAGDPMSTRDWLQPAAIGGASGLIVGGGFHALPKPKFPGLQVGKYPWNKATLGIGLMGALSAGGLAATNRGGERTNSLEASVGISTLAFGIPGIWIHGKEDFSGKPVKSIVGTMGVAATGALVGIGVHYLTKPRD